MKRFYLFSILVLTLCTMFGAAEAATDLSDGYWQYTVDTSGAVITYYNGSSKDIEVPYFVGNHTVTGIGAYAFANKSITSISLPSSVVKIWSHAFYACHDLASVTMRSDMVSIEDYAFTGCQKMELNLYEATNHPLSQTLVKDSTPVLGDYAFQSCYKVTQIPEIPNLISIGNCALESTDIASFVIPDTVTSIGNFAFSNCDQLQSITIPDSVTSIGNSAFAYCYKLKSIRIPDAIKTLNSTFMQCTGLESVTYSPEMEALYDPFSYCESLKEVTIPATVTTFTGCFQGCISLMNIHVAEGNPLFKEVDGVVYSNDLKTLLFYPRGRTTFQIIDGVTAFADDAMMYCQSLTSVHVPEGVTSIGEFGLSHCTSMTELVLPSTLTTIGESAFYNSAALRSIEIPRSVTSFGKNAFCWCKALTDITIPANMQEIPSSMYSVCSSLLHVTIEKGVTSIGSYAFSSCDQLSEVFIPATVTSIGNNAFGSLGAELIIRGYDGTYAETYAQENGYTWVSDGSVPFDTLTLPSGLKEIGEDAFVGIAAEKIVIPASCKTIAVGAFAQCSNLMIVEIHQAQGTFDDYNFGEGVVVRYITP